MNPTPSIEDQIKEFIALKLLFTPGGFGHPDDTSFLDAGIIDSLGVMELVEFVGKRFGIAVDPAEVTPEHFDSVRRLSAFVRKKQAAQSK